MDLINRLIAAESEEQSATRYMTQIDEAFGEAKAEGGGEPLLVSELKDQKEGAMVNREVMRQNARRTRDQIRRAPGGEEMLKDVDAMMAALRAEMKVQSRSRSPCHNM